MTVAKTKYNKQQLQTMREIQKIIRKERPADVAQVTGLALSTIYRYRDGHSLTNAPQKTLVAFYKLLTTNQQTKPTSTKARSTNKATVKVKQPRKITKANTKAKPKTTAKEKTKDNPKPKTTVKAKVTKKATKPKKQTKGKNIKKVNPKENRFTYIIVKLGKPIRALVVNDTVYYAGLDIEANLGYANPSSSLSYETFDGILVPYRGKKDGLFMTTSHELRMSQEHGVNRGAKQAKNLQDLLTDLHRIDTMMLNERKNYEPISVVEKIVNKTKVVEKKVPQPEPQRSIGYTQPYDQHPVKSWLKRIFK